MGPAFAGPMFLRRGSRHGLPKFLPVLSQDACQLLRRFTACDDILNPLIQDVTLRIVWVVYVQGVADHVQNSQGGDDRRSLVAIRKYVIFGQVRSKIGNLFEYVRVSCVWCDAKEAAER